MLFCSGLGSRPECVPASCSAHPGRALDTCQRDNIGSKTVVRCESLLCHRHPFLLSVQEPVSCEELRWNEAMASHEMETAHWVNIYTSLMSYSLLPSLSHIFQSWSRAMPQFCHTCQASMRRLDVHQPIHLKRNEVQRLAQTLPPLDELILWHV